MCGKLLAIVVIRGACAGTRQNFEGEGEQVKGLGAAALVRVQSERCLSIVGAQLRRGSRLLRAKDGVKVVVTGSDV